MYKSNSGLGSYSNRFCLILAILLSEKQVHLSATALILNVGNNLQMIRI